MGGHLGVSRGGHVKLGKLLGSQGVHQWGGGSSVAEGAGVKVSVLTLFCRQGTLMHSSKGS